MGSRNQDSDSAGQIKLGPLSRFPEGRGVAVQVAGDQVAVFNVGGQLFALEDACPHMGASLAEGQLAGRRITCHWHGWSFDLRSGASGRRSGACARVYELSVRDGEVYVTPPADEGGRPTDSTAASDDDDAWVPFDPDKHLKK